MSNTMILKDKSVQVSRIRRSSSFVMKRPTFTIVLPYENDNDAIDEWEEDEDES